jgi:HAD-superfamily class IIA hydrolase, TIGR01459
MNRFETKELEQLSNIADSYDAFVFSIYGVLHDDRKIHEGALSCLEHLAKLGKKVAIFSNVARRRTAMMQELAIMGIPASYYQHIITAGEVTHQYLKQRKDPFHTALGRKCYFIGPVEALEILEGLDFTRVHFIDEADFILALGADEWHHSLTDYTETLIKAAEQNIPMICGNPDVYVNYYGHKALRAGAMAQFYESVGGKVVYHGKPHKVFYKALIQEMSPIPTQSVLVLGDSLKIDILGAQQSGLDSLLIINNTTLDGLELSPQSDLLSLSLDNVYEKLLQFDIIPTYFTKELRW